MKLQSSNIINLVFISSSNIVQQLLSIFTTILLIKFHGVENYGSYIGLLSVINLISLFVNPILSPYFLREGTLEFAKKNILEKTFSISIFSILIFIILFILFFDFINIKFNLVDKKFYIALIFFLISLTLISLLKIISRITNRIIFYTLVTIIDKFVLSIVLVLYFLLNNFDFFIIFKTYSILLFSICILIFFFFRDIILITIKLKDIFSIFYKSLSYLYLSAFIFFFINQYYLILLIKNISNNNIIVGTLGFAFLLINMIYFPVYWLEQNYAQKYYKEIKVFNKKNFDNYFHTFGYLIASIVIITSSLLLLIIYNSHILIILDINFFNEKILICVIILLSLSVSLDTILSIPIFAIKEEKTIFIGLICRFFLFYLFYYFNQDPLNLIYIYVSLCYFQNLLILLIIYFRFTYFEKNLFYLIILYFILILLFFLEYILFFNIIISLMTAFSLIFFLKKFKNIKYFLFEKIKN
jgi:O-antigen/teichoic acid export membrane protein